MKLRHLLPLFCLAACTLQDRNGQIAADFTPPLVQRDWHKEVTTSAQGDPVCALKAHSLGVLVKRNAEAVYYIPDIDPGEQWMFSSGSTVLRSYDAVLSPEASKRAIQALLSNANVYTELARKERFAGGSGADITRLGDKIALDDFPALYHQCRQQL